MIRTRFRTRSLLRTLPVILAASAVGCADTDWRKLESASGTLRPENGPALFWRALGTGTDTAIVLHGGVGLHHGYLLEPFAPLARNRTLIFYDMRGRGKSAEFTDSSALTFDNEIGDLDAVRRHFNLKRVTLIGHHWGGAVAALYAARNEGVVERLLLVSPFPVHNSLLHEMSFMPGDSVRYRHALGLAGRMAHTDSISASCPDTWTLFFTPLRTDARTPYDRLAPAICDAPPDRLARSGWIKMQEQRSLGMWSWRLELNTLKVPMLVIEGGGDSGIVAEAAVRWAQHVPGGRVLLLDAPHLFPWTVSPKDFHAAAAQFLRGDIPARSVEPGPWRPPATTLSRPSSRRMPGSMFTGTHGPAPAFAGVTFFRRDDRRMVRGADVIEPG